MSTTLNGNRLFDEQQLEIEPTSAGRDSVERKIAGLDGVISIDLGSRKRMIKQRGSLRASSQLQMNSRLDAISAFLDGDTHTLITGTGETVDNLRMDVFKVHKEQVSGSGLAVDYEIVYTQLAV